MLIADSSFRLVYNLQVFRLDHIDPQYPIRGDNVLLGNVESKEKKTIAFYLDPQICTESYLDGNLTFKDVKGNFNSITMSKKLVSVVCPILFTDENINTAMLKRMAVEELDKKDSKVFSVPSNIPPETAFEIGKAAIQHHDVRLVREMSEKNPYIGEAWYYGKAKGRNDKIVVRIRVLADMSFLEFYVASNSLLMLTGMLAELKSDLNKELDLHKIPIKMKQITDHERIKATITTRTLLDKTAQIERKPGELEMGRIDKDR